MKPDYIIFTDASVKLVQELNYSAYAAVILNCESLQYTTISGPLANRSIVFCEGWAIYQGLRYLKKIQRDTGKKHLKVLIVTDSKLTVNTFTVWIKQSWDTSDWFDWKKSDGRDIQRMQDVCVRWSCYCRLYIFHKDSRVFLQGTDVMDSWS